MTHRSANSSSSRAIAVVVREKVCSDVWRLELVTRFRTRGAFGPRGPCLCTCSLLSASIERCGWRQDSNHHHHPDDAKDLRFRHHLQTCHMSSSDPCSRGSIQAMSTPTRRFPSQLLSNQCHPVMIRPPRQSFTRSVSMVVSTVEP